MAEAEQGAPARGATIAVALCFMVAVLEGFDIQAIGLVAPRLAEAANLGRDQLGLVFAMANVGLVTGAAFGGWLADRIGRKPVFIFSVVTFGVFTLATMLASDYYSLLIVRVLTGIGLGAAMPNMIAIASEVSRPENRNATTTAMFCGMPLGGGVAAIYIANLPAHFDWRTIFLVGGLIPLGVAVLIFLFMSETRRGGAGAHAQQANPIAALFGEGRGLSTILIWLIFFPTLMILYILLNWLPSMVADKGLGKPLDVFVGALKIGVNASFVFNIVSVAGALLFGKLVDKIGFRWPIIVAYVALFGGLVGLAQAMEMAPVLLYSGVAGFFLLGAQYSLYGVAAAYYPAAVRGVGAGFAVAVGRTGAILGPIAAGEMLSGGMDTNQTIMALAPLAAIAGTAVVLLSFRKQAA